MNATKRLEIRVALDLAELQFVELDSRMNYGLIGWLETKEGGRLVTIFPDSFYVNNKDFAINLTSLKLIQNIQKEFAELTRNDKGKILTFS